MRAVIYYPHINPPLAWLKQSLLYWDRICTVVHADFQETIDPDLAWLLDQGVYEPVFPDRLPNDQAERLLAEVLDYLSLPGRQVLGSQEWAGRGRHIESIYYGKLPERIEEELGTRGYLRETQHHLETDSELFGILLCLIAKYLSRTLTARDEFYSIGTTTAEFEACNFQTINPARSEACIQFALETFLPVPKDHVPLSDLLDFKQQNEEQLRAFRRALDRLYSTIAAEGPEQRAMAVLQEEVGLQLTRLSTNLARSRIETVLLSLSVLVPTGAYVWAPHEAFTLAIPWMFSGAATVALATTLSRFIRPGERSADFSYVHRAIREFGH
jgi:hypothetical protein